MPIRHATLADTPALVAMAARFLATSPYGALLPTTPTQIERLVTVVRDAGTILLAEVDGQAVGLLALLAADHPLNGRPYAEELAWWVEPEHRGGHLGAALLAEAEAWAAAQGLGLLKMVAPEPVDGLGAFYEARGYRPLERAYVKALPVTGRSD